MSGPAKVATDLTPASVIRNRMKRGGGLFRCDRCDRVFPETMMIVQDGLYLCTATCKDWTSKTEQNVQLAKELGTSDRYQIPQRAPSYPTAGAVAITSMTWTDTSTAAAPTYARFPARVIANGWTTATVTIAGVNLTGVVPTCDDSNVTIAVTTSTATSLIFTLTGTKGASPAKSSLTIAGTRFFNHVSLEAKPALFVRTISNPVTWTRPELGAKDLRLILDGVTDEAVTVESRVATIVVDSYEADGAAPYNYVDVTLSHAAWSAGDPHGALDIYVLCGSEEAVATGAAISIYAVAGP